MIVFKKLGLLGPILSAAVMRFSEQVKRQQLSLIAQKAVWATSIIQTISKAKLPSNIRDPTLRDVILNLPNPSSKFEFQFAAKNEVMKLFTEGINLLIPPFMQQSRIIDAQQENDSPITQSESSPLAQFYYIDPSSKRFIFFPIRTVATPMFNLLNDYKQKPDVKTQNFLITGGFGIGKTASIILYIHLSYHQTRFIYEASKDGKKKEEYNKLTKLQLIPENVVKYWFWEMYTNLDQQFKQIILAQAVEVEPAVQVELMKQRSRTEFIEKLRSHYQIPGLSTRSIVDQVSRIAEFMRESNYNLKKMRYRTSPEEKAFELDQSFKTFLKLGTCYTLNSSAAIERKLLGRGDNGRFGLDLVDSQREISAIHIPYEATMSKKAGQLEFWQVFWFEIERRANLPPAQLEAAKQTFIQSIESKNLSNMQTLKTSTLPAFSCFVYIRLFLSKTNKRATKSSSKNYTQLLNSIMSQNHEKIQEIINDFNQFCLQKFWKQMKIFLGKGEREYKRQILLKLYLKARSLKEKDEYRSRGFLLTIPQLDEILKEGKSSLSFEEDLLQSEEARDDLKPLLAFQTRQAVKFIFTVEQFTRLAELILFQGKSVYADFFISQMQKDQGSVSRIQITDEKLAPQKYLINYLMKQNVLAFKAIQKPSNIQVDKIFSIHEIQQFYSLTNLIKVKLEKSAFEWHFPTVIQMALRYPGRNILASPYIIVDGLFRPAQQSPTVDFAIVRYDDLNNRFRIDSFEVTVSCNLTQRMLQARNLFTELFEGVTSIQGIPFQITHTYLCPKDATYQQQEINNAPPLTIPLTISYADLSDIMIMAMKIRKHVMLKYIVNFNTLEKEKNQYGALYLKHDI